MRPVYDEMTSEDHLYVLNIRYHRIRDILPILTVTHFLVYMSYP